MDFVSHHGGFAVPDAEVHPRMIRHAYDVAICGTREVLVRPNAAVSFIAVRRMPRPPEIKHEIAEPERKKRKWTRRRHARFQVRLARAVSRGEDVARIENVLGYTITELKQHLARQFSPGMSWGNYASAVPFNRRQHKMWCIDHIVPKKLFDHDDVRGAFAISNLRPLWWRQNMRKGARRTHLI